MFINTKKVGLSSEQVRSFAAQNKLQTVLRGTKSDLLGRIVIVTTNGALEVHDGDLRDLEP